MSLRDQNVFKFYRLFRKKSAKMSLRDQNVFKFSTLFGHFLGKAYLDSKYNNIYKPIKKPKIIPTIKPINDLIIDSSILYLICLAN